MPERLLFATPLYTAPLAPDLGGAGLEALRIACLDLAENDRAGRAWCRANGYRGYTSYASLNDLPRRDPAFAALKRRLDGHVARFAEALAFDLAASGRLKLDSLWVNVLRAGAAHSGHIHPHSAVSGTLYVTMPEGAGGLRLEDPRLPLMMAAPRRRKDAPEPLQPFVALAPQAGEVVLWESWLRHEAVPGTHRGERISVSFNYA